MTKLTTEEFIKKSIQKHNNKYNYEKSVYTYSKNKIIITCFEHGDFEQLAGSHLNGCGCLKCFKKNNKINNTKLEKDYIKEALEKHNYKYSYEKTKYLNTRSKIIVTCPIHGDFNISANGHLTGSGCLKCGILKRANSMYDTIEDFIEKANKVHKNRYDYSLSEYKNSKTKVDILCKEHGKFPQEPRMHLSGAGCPFCNMYVGYSKSQWINYNVGKEGIFYIIECWNENERFFKIGITGNTIEKRYYGKNAMPYNWKIIKEIKSFDLNFIWHLEKEEKRKLKTYKYKPNITFSGSSVECFNTIDFKNQILQ